MKITLKIHFTSTNILQRTEQIEQSACYWIKSDLSTENTETETPLRHSGLVRYKAVHAHISIVLCSIWSRQKPVNRKKKKNKTTKTKQLWFLCWCWLTLAWLQTDTVRVCTSRSNIIQTSFSELLTSYGQFIANAWEIVNPRFIHKETELWVKHTYHTFWENSTSKLTAVMWIQEIFTYLLAFVSKIISFQLHFLPLDFFTSRTITQRLK